ncbi:MAG: hypothetical protein JOZ32_18420 [Bryobacterales bacterium]|nr:hypothetical protein [Bryobacterales bacterium]
MSYRRPWKCSTLFCLSAALLAGAADKKLPIDETSNDLLDISVAAPLDKDQIKQELGSDLGDDIIVVRVTARPVSDKPVQINRDDFLLVSGKDGQRSQPFQPGQLAGSDSLAVTENGMRSGGLGQHPHRPSIGFGGLGIGGGGNSSATQTPDTKMQESRADKENPLLAALNAKTLAEKTITEPISGLLCFQIVGKVKTKDLELHYRGAAGTMALRFRPEK